MFCIIFRLVLPGGGRYDNPGHRVKYGPYSFMEQRFNKVLHTELM